MEEISFVGFLKCTLCTQNLPAQQAATEIRSLGTFRDEIISFVKSAILYVHVESSSTVIPYQPAFSATQGIQLSSLPVPY